MSYSDFDDDEYDGSGIPGREVTPRVRAIAEAHLAEQRLFWRQFREKWASDNPGHLDGPRQFLEHPNPGRARFATADEIHAALTG